MAWKQGQTIKPILLRGTGKTNLFDYLIHLDVRNEENLAHNQLIEAYKEFIIVGGMPEAVLKYSETGSFLQEIFNNYVTFTSFQSYSLCKALTEQQTRKCVRNHVIRNEER